MTFNKPSDMRYTDMAIYVDDHIYEKKCDDQKCYEYLYHLCKMIAVKKRFFNTSQDYENYALFAASKIFTRYRNPKQKSDNLPPIKSCLNYIKKIAYPLRVDYQQREYSERFQPGNMPPEDIHNVGQTLVANVLNMDNERIQSEVIYYLQATTRIIKTFLRNLPYKNDKLMMHRLYVSCCLSVLKMITLSRDNAEALRKKIDKPNSHTEDNIMQIYQEESQDTVVLFHLDETMRNYVHTLILKIKRLLSKDISYLSDHHELSEDIIQNILTSPLVARDNWSEDDYY